MSLRPKSEIGEIGLVCSSAVSPEHEKFATDSRASRRIIRLMASRLLPFKSGRCSQMASRSALRLSVMPTCPIPPRLALHGRRDSVINQKKSPGQLVGAREHRAATCPCCGAGTRSRRACAQAPQYRRGLRAQPARRKPAHHLGAPDRRADEAHAICIGRIQTDFSWLLSRIRQTEAAPECDRGLYRSAF
jgi:hypothetical protein